MSEAEKLKQPLFTTNSLTDKNILHFCVHNCNVDVINAYDGLRFDLADLPEFELYVEEVVAIEKGPKLWESLREHHIVEDALNKCQMQFGENEKNEIYDFLISGTLGGEDNNAESAKQMVKKLIFFPTRAQVIAFIKCMIDNYNENIISYVHCAGGTGRTACYLTCLIMYFGSCSFETARNFLLQPGNYQNDCKDEIERYRKSVEGIDWLISS